MRGEWIIGMEVMTLIKQSRLFQSVLLALALLPSNSAGQIPGESPRALIEFLSRSTMVERMGLFSCGSVNRHRAAAISLANHGASAIPALNDALDSIEGRGRQSTPFHAGWLLLAYARIQGPSATPRLRRMLANPRLAFLQRYLDEAVALSLSLTSYLSAPREPELGDPPQGVRFRTIRCTTGSEEPRDALDLLIRAWASNDRPLLEACLGPAARTALNSSQPSIVWRRWRAGVGIAVGYRFEVPGRWSEPDETLEELETQFSNNSGAGCATHKVTFRKVLENTDSSPMYVVDNDDIAGILRSISACAEQSVKGL